MNGSRPFPKLLYAHRGANLRIPENTIEAFRNGLQAGANALELDVRRTRDNQIVVFHDAGGFRVAGRPERIKDCSLEQVKGWRLGPKTGPIYRVPTLVEVIEAFPNVLINVDIKDHDLKAVSLTVEGVLKQKAQDRVRLTSSSFRVIRMIEALRYTGPIGMSGLEIAALYFLPKALSSAFGFKGRAAQVPLQKYFVRFDTTNFVQKCHDLGVRVDYWVINDRETSKHMVQIGADGVMSDDPGIILADFTL